MKIDQIENRRHILVVDDNTAIHEDFRKALSSETVTVALSALKQEIFGAAEEDATPAKPAYRFTVDVASQGEEGVNQVAAARQSGDPYQVAFIDMRMPPGWDGLFTIGRLWQVDPRVQVVICSAYSDYSLDQIEKALGISDKLLILKKPFDRAEIVQLASTLSEKWHAERAAELKLDDLEAVVRDRTAEVEHVLLHDRLTGLPNRTSLQSRVNVCLLRHARAANQKFALLYLDFDHFKIINDSLGHDVGDELLLAIAQRLCQSCRQSDAICRFGIPSRMGGDEFLILLEDLRDERDAGRVAERLLAILREPYDVGGQQLRLTLSIGVTTSKDHWQSAADMIRDAETAMYRAKAAGRDCYIMFDPCMHEQVTARLRLEQALRESLQSGKIDVGYQPIVDLVSGRISGFEALLRWRHPAIGAIRPDEVVAIAEETGLIHALGMHVLRTACRQLKRWQAEYPQDPALVMSVNLSRHQLMAPGLVEGIAAVLRESDILPRTLALEITESAAFIEQHNPGEVLHQIGALGIPLHLDDFGTGYSSLSCLCKLPLSGLKIDRAFVRDMFQRRENAIVLEAIVRIAKAFDLQIIAEGVETTEQLASLRALNIDSAQGYLFGRAVSWQRASELLADGEPLLEAYQQAYGV
jgi:diguanylate cyclase (GGDEF)-like protein